MAFLVGRGPTTDDTMRDAASMADCRAVSVCVKKAINRCTERLQRLSCALMLGQKCQKGRTCEIALPYEGVPPPVPSFPAHIHSAHQRSKLLNRRTTQVIFINYT